MNSIVFHKMNRRKQKSQVSRGDWHLNWSFFITYRPTMTPGIPVHFLFNKIFLQKTWRQKQRHSTITSDPQQQLRGQQKAGSWSRPRDLKGAERFPFHTSMDPSKFQQTHPLLIISSHDPRCPLPAASESLSRIGEIKLAPPSAAAAAAALLPWSLAMVLLLLWWLRPLFKSSSLSRSDIVDDGRPVEPGDRWIFSDLSQGWGCYNDTQETMGNTNSVRIVPPPNR